MTSALTAPGAPTNPPSRGRRLLHSLLYTLHVGAGLGLWLAGFAVAYWLVASESENAPLVPTPLEPAVSWVRVDPEPVRLAVTATGMVVAAVPTALSSPVSAPVIRVHPALATGGRINAGTELVAFDSEVLAAGVAAAEQALARANKELARAEVVAARAQADLAAEPAAFASASPLRLGHPQGTSARAAVTAAAAELALARRHQADARVVASTDGWIIAPGVVPGSVVERGQSLVDWLPQSPGAVVVETALTPDQARWVTQRPAAEWSVRVHTQAGVQAGRILAMGERVGRTTGARVVRIAMNTPWDPAALPLGALAQVQLTSAPDPTLRLVPDDWLSPSGGLWLVDGERCLVAATPTVLGRQQGAVVVAAQDLPAGTLVVPGAVVTGRAGMRVRLVPEPIDDAGLQVPAAQAEPDAEPLFWIREGE